MKRTPIFALPSARRLRVLEASDGPELHAVIETNRAHLARWMPWAARQTMRDTLDFVGVTLRQVADDDGFQAAIVSDERIVGVAGPQIVGVAGFHGVDWPNRATSVGYWLAESEQGRGTMTHAIRALVGHAIGAWKLNRVEIRADAENLRSRAIPERLGFRQEGTLREAQRLGADYRDQVVYAVLAEEWIAAGASALREPRS